MAGKEGLTRRAFVKGTLATGAAAAAAGLAGCSGTKTEGSGAEAQKGLTADITTQKWAFEIPPAPIADKDIKKTVESDAVVIGGGTSGLVTACRLAEQGVKVTLIAQSAKPVGRGGSTFVMGSKLLEEKGLHIDVAKAYKKMMGYHSFRIDQNKWWLHANRSPEAMNWLIDLMTSGSKYGGVDLTPVLEAHFEDEEGILSEFYGTHDFIGGPNAPESTRQNPQQDVVENLSAYAKSIGVDLHYSTTGEQLVREDDNKGRVTAVVAREEDQTYTKYVGKKAVVLATGDFGQDKDMVHKYCPSWVWPLTGGIYNGTGHKMGLWAGAAWQKSGESAPMVFNFQYCMITAQVRAFSGLILNKEGQRFSNEDNVVSHGALACLGQTDMASYAVWDTAYAKNGPWGVDYFEGPSVAGENGEAMIKQWDGLCDGVGKKIDMNGASFYIDCYKSDSIEELAQKLELPADEVTKQVDRYNKFCASGVDEDYHKRAGLLHPITTPPYYMCRCEPWFLVATGGLRTNTNMQVLDESDAVIPGLYAVGTLVGDMYSNCYSTHFPGHNLGGNCLTFGYVGAEYIAKNA